MSFYRVFSGLNSPPGAAEALPEPPARFPGKFGGGCGEFSAYLRSDGCWSIASAADCAANPAQGYSLKHVETEISPSVRPLSGDAGTSSSELPPHGRQTYSITAAFSDKAAGPSAHRAHLCWV
ncbi:hypothetical protein SRHO_G00187530 [Serrasalmus rhombeus]